MATAATDGCDERRPSSGHRIARRPAGDLALASLVAAVVLPLLLLAVRALATPWTPASDQAIELLAVHDVGTGETPLIGAYSRLGWHHPGPLLFWVLAPFDRLAGPSGVLFAVALLATVSLLGALVAAQRLGGRPLAACVAGASAVLVHTLGPARLVDPWNPHVTHLPLLCFLLTIALAAQGGSRWPLPVAVLSGSFVVQCHLGTLAPVAAGALGAAVWWWRAQERPVAWPVPWRTTLLALGLWSGALLDQVAGRGNAADIARFVIRGDGARAPIRRGLEVAARELGVPPAVVGGREEGFLGEVVSASPWRLVVTVAVLLGAWAVARRADRPVPGRLVALAAWLVAAATVAVVLTTDGLLGYVLRWTWPVATFAAAAAAWASWEGAFAHRAPAERAAVVIAGGLAVAALSVATTIDATGDELRPTTGASRAVAALSTAARDDLPEGRYHLAWDDPVFYGGVAQSVGIDLVRHGWDIRFPESEGYVGDERTRPAPDAPTLVVVGGDRRATYEPAPGARRVASFEPRSPADERRLRAVSAAIARDAPSRREHVDAESAYEVDVLVGAGAARDDVEELRRLQGRGAAYDLWLEPAGAQN